MRTRLLPVLLSSALAAFACAVLIMGNWTSAAARHTSGGASESLFTGPRTQLARIVTPRPDSLLTGRALRVVVRLRAGTTRFRAWLDRRPVTGRFQTSSGATRRAMLPRKLLHAGVNHLTIRTADRRGRRDFDAAPVVAGRRSARLLSVRVRAKRRRGLLRTSGTLGVRVRLRGRVDRVLARLNGHGADAALKGGFLRRGRLTSADGLRFGRNVLKITAWRETGAWHRVRRVIVVSRSRPLVAAGRDRSISARGRMRLDGRASRSHRPGQRLSYTWRVLRHPKGSAPRLLASRSARPTFVSGRPGRYRLRLTVRDRRRGGPRASDTGPSASDTLELCVQPDLPPVGAALDTHATDGGRPAIKVGDQTYRYTPGFPLALVLDRCTLTSPYPDTTLVEPGQNGYRQYQSLLSEVVDKARTQGSSYLVILAAEPGVAAPMPDYTSSGFAAVTSVGPTSNPDPAKPDVVNRGQAVASDPNAQPDTTGAIAGYLQFDNYRMFTLAQAVTTPFETRQVVVNGQPRARIEVGSGSWTSEPLPEWAQAGFMLLALDRSSLRPVLGPLTTPANAGGTLDVTLQTILARQLEELHDSGGLVFVQSIGSPRPTTPAWGDIARAIDSLGGTAHVFNTLDGSGGYALVGCSGCQWPNAQEASFPMTKPGGTDHLNGRLGLDDSSQWVSRISDIGAGSQVGNDLDYDLAEIAILPPSSWPCGLGADNKPIEPPCSAGHQAALNWITETVLFSQPNPQTPDRSWCQQIRDFRASYCSGKPPFASITADLSGNGLNPVRCADRTDADGGPFTAQQCDEVRRELLLELAWRETVANWFSYAREPLADAKTTDYMDLNDIYTHITQATPIDTPQGDATPSLSEFLVSTLTVLSLLPGEEFPEAMGDLVTAISLAGGTTNDQNGTPVFDELAVASAQLAEKMVDRYSDVHTQLGMLENQFLSDYGKLSAAKDLPGLSDPLADSFQNPLRVGGIQWIWQELLPKAYTLYKFRAPPSGFRLNDLNCLPQGDVFHPFAPLSDNESWTPVLGFDSNMRQWKPFWFAPGIGDLITGYPGLSPQTNLNFKVPSGPMFDKLWRQPPSNSDPTLPGLYEPWFHRRAEWLKVTDYSVGRFPVLSTSTMCWYGSPGHDYHEP